MAAERSQQAGQREKKQLPREKWGKRKKWRFRWAVQVFFIAIALSAVLSFCSNEALEEAELGLAFCVLAFFILLGIVFDIIGVAATSADETPFHSMAAKKVPEAREALKLLRRAERVSSFCNDVVGDICGVISGSASAVIAARAIVGMESWLGQLVQLLMSAVVAGLTVGGKAFGKSIAIKNSTMIIHAAAKLIYGVKSMPRWILETVRRN